MSVQGDSFSTSVVGHVQHSTPTDISHTNKQAEITLLQMVTGRGKKNESFSREAECEIASDFDLWDQTVLHVMGSAATFRTSVRFVSLVHYFSCCLVMAAVPPEAQPYTVFIFHIFTYIVLVVKTSVFYTLYPQLISSPRQPYFVAINKQECFQQLVEFLSVSFLS